jgi:myb-related protein
MEAEIADCTHIAPESPSTRRCRFSHEEDNTIRAAVNEFGCHEWRAVAERVGNNRIARQVRERWNNFLSPPIQHAFTDAEDEKLMELASNFTGDWAQIARIIGNRSAIQVRNRVRKLSRRLESSAEVEDQDDLIPLQVHDFEIYWFSDTEGPW